jgi:hypothetical protein
MNTLKQWLNNATEWVSKNPTDTVLIASVAAGFALLSAIGGNRR